MTEAVKTRNNAIDDALNELSPKVSRNGPQQWQVVISNGSIQPVTVWIDQEWLRLDVSLKQIASEKTLWKLLNWNSQIAGLAKFAVRRKTGALHLRAEIPCRIEGDVGERLRETCEGFRMASGLMNGEKAASRDIPYSQPSLAPSDLKSCDLASLCRAAGWSPNERANGEAVVELANLQGSTQAIVEKCRGGVLIRAELARTANYTELSRAALSLFLLSTSGIVRMARAATRDEIEEPGGACVRFEVGFATPPSSEEIGLALSAIEVASRLARREAEVFRHEEVARQYLASGNGVGLREPLPITETSSTGGQQNGNHSSSQTGSRTRSERRLWAKAAQGEQRRPGRDDR